MMTSTGNTDGADLRAARDTAEQILADRAPGLTSSSMPTPVLDQFVAFRDSIGEINSAGDQLSADLAELDAKRDYLLPAAYHRLRAQAKDEALTRGKAAERAAAEHLDGLKNELEIAAAPKVNPDPQREALARQTFEAAIAGGDTLGKVLRLANGSNREAAAVAFSDHGATVLENRGLDVPETLRAARTTAANAAKEYGTDAEKAASVELGTVDALGAATGAAGLYLRHVAGDA